MRTSSAIGVAALVGSASAACGINQAATQLIQGYEKYNATPYPDHYGYWTIGYGHRCVPNNQQCSDVPHPISEPAAQQLFAKDISKYANCLSNALSICLNDNQYGALVSWTFNEGCGERTPKRIGMAGSTLIDRLNNHEDPDTVAQQELPKWNRAGGGVSQGLVRRRNSEIQLFTTANSGGGNCNCGGNTGGGGGSGGGGGGGGSGGGGGGGGGNSGYSNSPSYSDYSDSPGGYSAYSGGYPDSSYSTGGSPGSSPGSSPGTSPGNSYSYGGPSSGNSGGYSRRVRKIRKRSA